MVCLDTSFVIDLFRANNAAKDYMSKLEANNEIVAMASPTIIELMSTANLNQNKKEKEELMNFLSSIIILDLNKESAILAGEIEAHLIIAGEMIGTVDIMIGAIAKHNNETLITRNKKHFDKIPGLKIESY